MTSFLFWNVMKQDLRNVIACAVVEREVDILLLAESGTSDAEIVAAINEATGCSYESLSNDDDKVRLITRLPAVQWKRRQADPIRARMAVWSVTPGRNQEFLLATVHFISRNNTNREEQGILAVELAKEIIRVEEGVGHQRTIVVGDLNMNPFDVGVTGAPALHAVMTRKLAERGARVVNGIAYPFFYNPMWGFFGDRTAGPPGTYYRRSASPGDMFWHMLDQVLLRPSLMDRLDDLAILDSIGGESLLTQSAGVPRKGSRSDHLPLAFRLQLE